MTDSLQLADAAATIDLFQQAAEAMIASTHRSQSIVRLPGRGRLLATGDLHDHPIHLRKILRLARLEASDENHVVLHEIVHGGRLVNGMDFSYRMLGRVAGLVTERPDQVHPVLANHELAQMTGKGVSKGAGDSVQLFRDALDYVFHDACVEVADAIDRFIRAMPIALLSDSGVLCAHSLPAASAMKHFDPDLFERALRDEDYAGPRGSAYLMVWGRQQTEQQLQGLAERWGVKLFCLGHEHVETGIEVRGRRVVVLNSDHERATVVPIDLSQVPEAEEALLAAVPLAAVPEDP